MDSAERAPATADSGFTLIELLVALGVGVALIGAAATALVLTLSTTGAAQDQIQEAARIHVTARWFLADVNGVKSGGVRVAGDDENGDDGPACAGIGDAEFVGGFDDAFERHVDWWVDGGELLRTSCDADGDPDGDPLVLTSGIDDPADVTIECPADDQPSRTCTLTWTVQLVDQVDETRTHTLTATRRGWS